VCIGAIYAAQQNEFFSKDAMSGLSAYLESAELGQLWRDEALLAAMLRFELELARAQAELSIIPHAHAHELAAVVREQFSDQQQLQALAQSIGKRARNASTLAIPLVDDLRAAVSARNADAAMSVHFGATSQDVIDSALMLQSQASLHWIDAQLAKLGNALAQHVKQHRDTPMMGRTLLQAAVPISFGYKAAVWLSGVARSRAALRELPLCLQLGGAAGTLHSIDAQGAALVALLAKKLGLDAPHITWHAQRDGIARLASELAILCGVLGKFGMDVALAAQNEVAELSEPHEAGRGASSAMAHKHNPVGAMHMLQAAQRAPDLLATLMRQLVTEHERALGGWQAQLFVLRDLFNVAGGALEAAVEVAVSRGDLQINTAQMQINLRGETLGAHAAAQAMMDQVLKDWSKK
jgi:3-carboxy-cis,cis-muconate cycloisomerase